jgi:hypothetical protein
MEIRQPVHCRLWLLGTAINLGAIAGRNDRRLSHRAVAHKIVQCVFHRIFRKRNLLTHVQRCGLMVNAKGK